MKLEKYLKGHDHFWLMHLTYIGGEGSRLWKYAKENGLTLTLKQELSE